MKRNDSLVIRKRGFGVTQFVVGTFAVGALTFTLMTTAFARPKTGERTALDGVQHMTCRSVCVDRYFTCISGGTDPNVCFTRYQTCLYYCGGSGAAVPTPTEPAQ